MSETTNPTPKRSLIKRILIWLLSILAAACLVAGITIPVLVIRKGQQEIPGSNVSNSATSEISNENYDYLNKNSVSLLFSSTPRVNFLANVYDGVKKHYGANYDVKQQGVATIDCGTSWIVDYSTNPNANLVTYYLATNIHVVNLAYTLNFSLLPKQTNNLFQNVQAYNLSLSFAINPNTTSSFAAYICQPLGKKTPDYPNGLSITSNDPHLWNQEWFQIPNINLNTLNENIIPLGAINNKNQVVTSTGYQGSYSLKDPLTNKTIESGYVTQNGYVPKRSANVNVTNQGQDFALVKMQLKMNQTIGPNSSLRFVWPYGWINTIDNNTPLAIMFKQMNAMFNINPVDKISIQSTYLQKLNYLIQKLENKTLTKEEFNKYFMFGDVKKLDNTQNLYIAGYPGGMILSSGLADVYFNAGQTLANSIIQASSILGRNRLEYYYQGKVYLEDYWRDNNYFLPGVNLYPGSSGSMVINDNNQIMGIYWGAIQSTGSVGIFTPFYFKGNKNNLLYKLLQYQAVNDPNSQLVHLFKLLANWNNQ